MQLHLTPPDNASQPPSIDLVTDYAALAFVETVLSRYPSVTLDLSPLLSSLALTNVVEPILIRADAPSPDLAQPPASFRIAKTRSDRSHWELAMGSEFQSLQEKDVFERVPRLPPGRKAIPLMWVYDFKHLLESGVVKEKARLVVLGNLQGALDHAYAASQ